MNQGSDTNSSDRHSPQLSSAATRLLSYFLLYPKRDEVSSEAVTAAVPSSLLFRFRIKPSNEVFLMNENSKIERNGNENEDKMVDNEAECSSKVGSGSTSVARPSQSPYRNTPPLNKIKKINNHPKNKGKRRRMTATFAQKVFMRNNKRTPIRRNAKLESIKCELRNFRLHHIHPNSSDFQCEAEMKSPTNPPLQQLIHHPQFSSISLPAFPTFSTSDERDGANQENDHPSNNNSPSLSLSHWLPNPSSARISASITADKYHGPDLLEQYRRRKRPPIRNYCTTNHPLRQMYSLEDLIGSDNTTSEGGANKNQNDKNDSSTDNNSTGRLNNHEKGCFSNVEISGGCTPGDRHAGYEGQLFDMEIETRSVNDVSDGGSSSRTDSSSSAHSDDSKCHKYHSLDSIRTYTTAPTGNVSPVTANTNRKSDDDSSSDSSEDCTVGWKTKLRRTLHIIKMKFKRFFKKAVND